MHVSMFKSIDSWEHKTNNKGKGWKPEVEVILIQFYANKYLITYNIENNKQAL